MRLPLGTGTAYQTLKWSVFLLLFGFFAANIVIPLAAIFFILLGMVRGLILTFIVWAMAIGFMMWMLGRQGRRERRAGEQRRHTDAAINRARPPAQLQNDYDLLDVGVKPFRTGQTVFRDEALPDDIPGFYPTVRLWMHRSYAGRLYFEFYDDDGNIMPHYTHSRRVLLLNGHRNITSRDEVLLGTHEFPEDTWSMHVRLNDHLLAVHRLAWFPVGLKVESEEDFVYPHAQAAVQRAGAAINDARPTLTDVGLLTLRAGVAEADIRRTEAVPHDTESVQPFVRFNLPARAAGQIRFLLLDGEGHTQFDCTERHDYNPGDNLIAARARMRVDDDAPLSTGWQLHVYVGQMLVAKHRFDWERALPEILDPLDQDGEITARLRKRIADEDKSLSLRDLLNEQRRPR